MAYRNLTNKQFGAVRELARYICEIRGLKTVGDFKRIGNEIIDDIEAEKKKFVTDFMDDVVILEN